MGLQPSATWIAGDTGAARWHYGGVSKLPAIREEDVIAHSDERADDRSYLTIELPRTPLVDRGEWSNQELAVQIHTYQDGALDGTLQLPYLPDLNFMVLGSDAGFDRCDSSRRRRILCPDARIRIHYRPNDAQASNPPSEALRESWNSQQTEPAGRGGMALTAADGRIWRPSRVEASRSPQVVVINRCTAGHQARNGLDVDKRCWATRAGRPNLHRRRRA